MRPSILVAGLLCAAALSAADFSGTWLGEIPFPLNAQHLRISQQFAVKLVQSGTTVTGKLYGEYDSPPIQEGVVKGDTVDFIVVAQEQQGNQITESRLHFTGILKTDGSLELTRLRESASNAGNGGAYRTAKVSNNQQTFVIKRLAN